VNLAKGGPCPGRNDRPRQHLGLIFGAGRPDRSSIAQSCWCPAWPRRSISIACASRATKAQRCVPCSSGTDWRSMRRSKQTAGCNASHPVESRLARCLLQTHDLSCGCKLVLTQESMAQMIGARRNSVSLVASTPGNRPISSNTAAGISRSPTWRVSPGPPVSATHRSRPSMNGCFTPAALPRIFARAERAGLRTVQVKGSFGTPPPSRTTGTSGREFIQSGINALFNDR